MPKEPVRRVVGDPKAWKAMSHPLRREILRHLGRHGQANSTTIAEALGESTGTTSYHLRVLGEAGVIEEVPEKSGGRERWWRTIPTDRREPDYASLSPEDRAALDAWRASQIPGEIQLFQRMVAEFRRHGAWAKASRASGYFTVADLDAVFEEFVESVNRHVHAADDAPPGARLVHLRMFYLPDDEPGDG